MRFSRGDSLARTVRSVGVLVWVAATAGVLPACVEADAIGDTDDVIGADTTGATGADTDAGTDTDADAGSDTDTDADTGTDTDADTGADTGTDTDADTGADTGTGTDTDTDGDTDSDTDADTGDACVPLPPPEALYAAGVAEDGTELTPNGRNITARFPRVFVEGFPTQVRRHPTLDVAYVVSTSRDDRRIIVIDIETRETLQDIDRGQAFYGLAISNDGTRLYASGGINGRIDVYDVASDGTLTLASDIAVLGFPTGMALSPDGATLYAGVWETREVVVIDTATEAVTRRIAVDASPWDVAYVAGRNEVYLSELVGADVVVVDVAKGEVAARLDAQKGPAGMAVDPDGSRVWVASSGADTVLEIDTATHALTRSVSVSDPAYLGRDDAVLGDTNVNALAYDATRDRLYATMGAVNAVAVIDANSFEVVGTITASWYPTGVALGKGDATLVVIEGKGGGAGPNNGEGAKQVMKGTLTTVPLAGLDLAEESDVARTFYARPSEVFAFDCPEGFPIPTREGQKSPIEHVILIFKENKTFDCVFGDLTDRDVRRDITHLRYGEELTPNQHALARQFAISDNFYADVPNSDNGHIMMTAANVTEYFERIWLENGGPTQPTGFQLDTPTVPLRGNFFTHLLQNRVRIRIYGEIVGMNATVPGSRRRPGDFSDATYPGGPFTNYATRDEDKARYVIEKLKAGELAEFTYLQLPNDHMNGTAPGTPTPESMVADNDYATGLFIEALSQSPFWEKSVVFIVQDDPQGCADHIDAHRSFGIVVGPYVKRQYVSKVLSSFHSVHATIERILGITPINRQTATASPLYDMFTATPDVTPFTALPRVPEEVNPPNQPGAALSATMDFSGPDRAPDLYPMLDAYRLWKMGQITREEAERRIANIRHEGEAYEERIEESREETFAFDKGLRDYRQYLIDRGVPRAKWPEKIRALP